MGAAVLAPDDKLAVFGVRQYDFEAKKWTDSLYLMNMSKAQAMSDEELQQHAHLTHLASNAKCPVFSPCGNYIAFLSDRGESKVSAVWITPVRGPGEPKLLKEFPLPVGDLTWAKAGIVVSAQVYVDQQAADATAAGEDPMAATAVRDKALKDDTLGGLNAVIFKRLPVREWDRWLDAKMSHPFFLPVSSTSSRGYTAAEQATDLLAGAPTAVPSGAFGGTEDWAVASSGSVAFSARPPMSPTEAWTTNRHIYLKPSLSPSGDPAADDEGFAALLGSCLTPDNPGFNPFSHSFSCPVCALTLCFLPQASTRTLCSPRTVHSWHGCPWPVPSMRLMPSASECMTLPRAPPALSWRQSGTGITHQLTCSGPRMARSCCSRQKCVAACRSAAWMWQQVQAAKAATLSICRRGALTRSVLNSATAACCSPGSRSCRLQSSSSPRVLVLSS